MVFGGLGVLGASSLFLPSSKQFSASSLPVNPIILSLPPVPQPFFASKPRLRPTQQSPPIYPPFPECDFLKPSSFPYAYRVSSRFPTPIPSPLRRHGAHLPTNGRPRFVSVFFSSNPLHKESQAEFSHSLSDPPTSSFLFQKLNYVPGGLAMDSFASMHKDDCFFILCIA